MLKKISLLGLASFLVLAALSCNKAKNPVVPANAAVLHLTLPSLILNGISSKASTVTGQDVVPDSGGGALEYYLSTEGQAPVTGVIYFNSGSDVGNIYINLPKAGTWLVAGEWFNVSVIEDGIVNKSRSKLVPPAGDTASPEFAGAGEVDIQGTTAFTLNMQQITNTTEGVCYNAQMTDATNGCDFNLGGDEWEDFFTFNTAAAECSTIAGTTGDIQALYDPVTTLSTYLGSTTGASFAYLGNGDYVNFPVVPVGATFYPNTVAAKAAVVGSAGASIVDYDIFVVKGPEPNQMVWLQVWLDNPNCYITPNSSLMQLWFIYNNEGLNYMKFDQTTEGAAYCNQNNPTPVPTLAP